MAETIAEKGICDACGTKIRSGSAFCYNCGESVAQEPLPPAIVRPDPRELNGRSGKPDMPAEPEPPPVSPPVEGLGDRKDRNATVTQFPAAAEKGKTRDLKTAATVRRQAKAQVKKPVEVEWTERPPSITRFLITAIILAAIAGGLVAAAFYMR